MDDDLDELLEVERFWKFLRKQVLRNTYYATFAEFRAAIQRLLTDISAYADELTTLMTENFHLFEHSNDRSAALRAALLCYSE